MIALNELVRRIIRARQSGLAQITLLAVCPNSEAVLEAAIRAAARDNFPLLFAATLNQVDRDGGYTGWTPARFVQRMRACARRYAWSGPLYPCLDHAGPWLKDRHALEGLSLEETMAAVRQSLVACLKAGYRLLHIDPTVDRSLPPGRTPEVETVAARTVELIGHAEAARKRLGLPPVAYEVGSEEVHGGLVDLGCFERFLAALRERLQAAGLEQAWPCFVVAQVGTDLHTTSFDPATALRLYEICAPYGSLIKGHYTDWVENPQAYPASGMGGANVGPEFTAEEYFALRDLAIEEERLCRARGQEPSRLMEVLEKAVLASGRWKKWLLPGEAGLDFASLPEERRSWLTCTGARYIWTEPEVRAARRRLYRNLSQVTPDPHACVVERIARAIERYAAAFNLFDSCTLFEGLPADA